MLRLKVCETTVGFASAHASTVVLQTSEHRADRVLVQGRGATDSSSRERKGTRGHRKGSSEPGLLFGFFDDDEGARSSYHAQR